MFKEPTCILCRAKKTRCHVCRAQIKADHAYRTRGRNPHVPRLKAGERKIDRTKRDGFTLFEVCWFIFGFFFLSCFFGIVIAILMLLWGKVLN